MEGKTVWWMVLWGVVRHVLAIGGAWLASRGLIDEDTHTRLVAEGATQIVGWLLMLLPIAWSVLQKKQAWGWVKKAFHMAADTPPDVIAEAAPGPNVPI